jgi:hypothetical protein
MSPAIAFTYRSFLIILQEHRQSMADTDALTMDGRRPVQFGIEPDFRS